MFSRLNPSRARPPLARRAACLIAATGAIALAGVLVAGCGDDEPATVDPAARPAVTPIASPPVAGSLSDVRHSLGLPRADLSPSGKPRAGEPRFAIVAIRSDRTVALRDSPDGARIAKIGARTELGSDRRMRISKIRGDWLAVHVPELPNGRLGWIRDDRSKLDLFQTSYWLVADLSDQRLELRFGRRVLERIPVTVGRPSNPTPVGEYDITDALIPKRVDAYGCCILAISGHQPNLPANWVGGDRIAIHGTSGAVGGASSAGCLRTTNQAMIRLIGRVPLGTPVFIRS